MRYDRVWQSIKEAAERTAPNAEATCGHDWRTAQCISFYEVGDRIPSVEVIIKLTAALHVSTDFLLGVEKCDTFDLSGPSTDYKALVRTMADTLRQKNEYKK